MASIVVIGSQWGDEGKGKIIDTFTEFADAVVRFQGGGNAGHTVVVGDKHVILHQIPSGCLRANTWCIIGNGMVLDLETLMEEIGGLEKNGFLQDKSKLLISEEVQLVLPYHRLIDAVREKLAGDKKIGTTGRGIGPTYETKAARAGIRFADVFDEELFREKLAANIAEKRDFLCKRVDASLPTVDELFERYRALGEKLRPCRANISVVIHQLQKEGKNILFEGAQGTLLDVDHGTYPYVTSSNTTAGAACTGAGVGPTSIDAVIGIVKAYTTRVGEGPFPTEQNNEIGERLRDRGKEYGATTGRPRRCGWIDTVALRHACRINGFTSLALTKLDVLTGFEKIKICRAYIVDGIEVTEFPASLRSVQQCQPVYDEVDGWSESIQHVRRFADLPVNARKYIERLQDMLGVDFILISVGVDRRDTILLKNPFS